MHPKLLAKRILHQMNTHQSLQLNVSMKQETILGEEKETEEKYIETTRILTPETRIYAHYEGEEYYIDEDSFLTKQESQWSAVSSPFQEDLKNELRLDELLTKHHDLPLFIQDAFMTTENNQTSIVFDSNLHPSSFYTQVKQQYQQVAPQFHLHHLKYKVVIDEQENIRQLLFLSHVFFHQTELITTLNAHFSDFNQYNELTHPPLSL